MWKIKKFYKEFKKRSEVVAKNYSMWFLTAYAVVIGFISVQIANWLNIPKGFAVAYAIFAFNYLYFIVLYKEVRK